MRRFGERVIPTQKYKARPGVYAILPFGRHLLLTFQDMPVPELQLPGGGIDAGESPLQALHREVFEETGWHIRQARVLGRFRRFAYMPEYDLWAEKIATIYTAQPVYSPGPPTEAGHTAVFVDPAYAARHVANPGDRDFVRQYLRAERLRAQRRDFETPAEHRRHRR
ncbi:MAG: NUDIX hydrolase [Pseudomonadota bacterium]